MVTVVIRDGGEPKVTQLTYENLWRELKDIPGAELLIAENWFNDLSTKNKYICLVEADCLVSSGYFTSQIGLLKKDPYFRKLAMLASVTGVNNWANRFYGYSIDTKHGNKITPNKVKQSSYVDAVQIGYVPGALIRVSMLKKLVSNPDVYKAIEKDLVLLSTVISLGFWHQGDGNRVHLNPNSVYVTTEDYVNDLGNFTVDDHALYADLLEKFERESI